MISRYCVGYLDKTSGVITLRKTELITLNPRIPGNIAKRGVAMEGCGGDLYTSMVGTVESQVGEDQVIPEDQGITRKAANQMVKVFGSERRKRAFSAAQKNQLDTEVLETALEPAFSHVEASTEKTSSAGLYLHVSFRGLDVTCCCCCCCGRFVHAEFWTNATS